MIVRPEVMDEPGGFPLKLTWWHHAWLGGHVMGATCTEGPSPSNDLSVPRPPKV
jgi:hypothetical protein